MGDFAPEMYRDDGASASFDEITQPSSAQFVVAVGVDRESSVDRL